MAKPGRNEPAALSAGVEPPWRSSRPSLAADPLGDDVAAELPKRREPLAWSSAKAIAGVLAIAAGVAVAGWVILGLTVLPTMRIGDQAWFVKWAAHPEGQVPAGTIVAAGSEPVRRGLLDRAVSLAGLDAGSRAIYVIVAGPGSEARSEPDGRVIWAGTDTGYSTPVPIPPHLLGGSYLAMCVTGPCGEPGTFSDVPASHVLGTVIAGWRFPFTMTGPPQPPGR